MQNILQKKHVIKNEFEEKCVFRECDSNKGLSNVTFIKCQIEITELICRAKLNLFE